ncbi:hypothetical protein D6779_11440 [Candidatus Parcubacteria bacterium]|nr:MAG: hypothetical protein D6779_11440 [Candidatus Parcubacteria bacterium]
MIPARIVFALHHEADRVTIGGLCGTELTSDQIKENFARFSKDEQRPCTFHAEMSTEWRKGILFMPEKDELKNARKEILEKWARHIASNGMLPPPAGYGRHKICRQSSVETRNTKNIYEKAYRYLKIAEIMVDKQQQFLLSGNWMDKEKLTIIEISKRSKQWSEKVIRTSVHCMRFSLNGRCFAADNLLCSSILPWLCKTLVPFIDAHPNAGAPALTAELKREGIHVSQRMVGKALHMLAIDRARSMLKDW